MSASATSSNRFPEIPKYDLKEEIGHGGMATVYRAHDQRLERDVAVKVIHKHLGYTLTPQKLPPLVCAFAEGVATMAWHSMYPSTQHRFNRLTHVVSKV